MLAEVQSVSVEAKVCLDAILLLASLAVALSRTRIVVGVLFVVAHET